jgi:putative endonuclease
MCKYFVYMMANISRTLYTDVTNDLQRRVFEHKSKLIRGFTSRYNITKLVWFEEFSDVVQAIEGEKKIKGWSRRERLR